MTDSNAPHAPVRTRTGIYVLVKDALDPIELRDNQIVSPVVLGRTLANVGCAAVRLRNGSGSGHSESRGRLVRCEGMGIGGRP